MAQVINGVSLNNTEGFDKITSTDKITAGYFTGGDGKLEGNVIYTSSISTTNSKYYEGIALNGPTGSVQFHVTYGNINGYGSYTDSGNLKGATEAIYKEWANTLLTETEVTGGFKISQAGSSGQLSSGTKDDDVYVLVGKRSLFKDRINKKNWTIVMSGSDTQRSGSPAAGPQYPHGHKILHLTDDSNTTAGTATPAGIRYNIVSGSQGTVVTAASTKTYGWFYPDQGVFVFSGIELSASIPGSGSTVDTVAKWDSADAEGFGVTTNVDDNYKNALRLVNCLQGAGNTDTYIQARSEEDQTSVSYFCRARASHLNFSNNPTFVSGSLNELRHTTMKGNPTVYITGVELYDGIGNLVAVGKLSTPLKKNFSSEATIKVKLTF